MMGLVITAVHWAREQGFDEVGIQQVQAFDEFWLDPLMRDRVAGLDDASLPSEEARGWIHERVRRFAMAAWFQAIALDNPGAVR